MTANYILVSFDTCARCGEGPLDCRCAEDFELEMEVLAEEGEESWELAAVQAQDEDQAELDEEWDARVSRSDSGPGWWRLAV